MQTTEPRLVLEVVEWGKTRSVPLAPIHIRDVRDFWDFCRDNEQDTLRFERDADGRVRLMAPSGSETDNRNLSITFQMELWNQQNGRPGYVFGPSAGFTLPNGAVRSPDAAWVEKSRYEALTDAERATFSPLCPDFVLELLSPTDSLVPIQRKMEEYLSNGARLGILIDRSQHRVDVYRPGQAVETLNNPTSISGDPELPGFALDLTPIF